MLRRRAESCKGFEVLPCRISFMPFKTVTGVPVGQRVHLLIPRYLGNDGGSTDGFVEIVPYMGATVTEISADSVVEVFALLETMEAITARSACHREPR